MIKIVTALLLLSLIACDRSGRDAIDSCTLPLNFLSNESTEVVYEAALGSTCMRMVRDQSGGLSVTVAVVAPSSLGRLDETSFQDKLVIHHDPHISTLAAGGLTATQSFQQNSGRDSKWVAPWSEDALGFVRTTFIFPEGSAPESYPRSVTVILKFLD
ncbi:MAG: hypothetical protein EOP10_23325 [Proteobacteria bacterium]|nr:MAG: hypothetical protein EOP10_23325 [Pseudomonadota bacterium]